MQLLVVEFRRSCADCPICTECLAPHVSQEQVFDEASRSRFCLVPEGDDPLTSRLQEAIAAACLPVIASHDVWNVGEPFDRLIPWRQMSFWLDHSNLTTEALQRIAATPDNELQRMRHLWRIHYRDILWHVPQSRVAENILRDALDFCGGKNVLQQSNHA